MAVIERVADAGFPHRLKLAGRVPPHAAAELDALLAAAARADRVDVLGYVEDAASLYRSASVALVLSRYEGFGLPAAEAMASGTPLVAFNNSSLPEIVGDGGVLVPDGDVDAAADAVIAVLRSPALATDLRGRGLERAKCLTWPRCAALTAEVYRSVAPS
jgi:alpha-1,3-rhamnosyl/mannosyltransferase